LHDEAEHRVRGLGLHLGFVHEHGDAARALARVGRSASELPSGPGCGYDHYQMLGTGLTVSRGNL
jgi:hypothetical protein